MACKYTQILLLFLFLYFPPTPIKTYLGTNLIQFPKEGVGGQNSTENFLTVKLSILHLKFEKVIKITLNVPKSNDNHLEQLVFGLG